ncbi:MAG: arginine--tRNA ligase [Sphingomonadales bacterium]|nr:arginine--tRNA ligase [Sphingomonadales bacterium]
MSPQEHYLRTHLQPLILREYAGLLKPEHLVFQQTRKDFSGDITLVLFGPAKRLSMNPLAFGERTRIFLGTLSFEGQPLVESSEIVQGFLNISLSAHFWMHAHQEGSRPTPNISGKKLLVEFASPNTNKPLHLGHIRNILLGMAVSRLSEEAGDEVVRVQVINDRGIHICKSMLAWEKFGQGETPQSSGLKGDHLVGKYYVRFDVEWRRQTEERKDGGMDARTAKDHAPILLEAQQMLRDWEVGVPGVRALWQSMNGWVYSGFDQTHQRLGSFFDRNYYESETYVLGRDQVLDGLARGVFERDPDGSVWANLTGAGLDRKVLLRSDGTSVYITQDIGTAIERQKEWNTDEMTYVVGNEQDYHFKVLFLVLQRLGYEWASRCHHLSYGMVDLPSGRMKSREGTVVDADDLMDEMVAAARDKSEFSEKLMELSEGDKTILFNQVGMAALKYFILKVDPQKRMVFHPEESIDLQGHTGPFIQYAHARACAVLRKAESIGIGASVLATAALPSDIKLTERELMRQLSGYRESIFASHTHKNPSLLCQYAYDLAGLYNRFYHDCPILTPETTDESRLFRLYLSQEAARVLKRSLFVLGIEAPDRM